MTVGIAGSAVAYLAVTLLFAGANHIGSWRLFSETMKSHHIVPDLLRPIAQLTVVGGQVLVGGWALYLLLGTRRLEFWPSTYVLGCGLGASVVFAMYTWSLKRRGFEGSCGCYFLGASGQASSPNYVLSIGLCVASVVGLAALMVAEEPQIVSVPEAACSLLLGLTNSLLVQCAALMHHGYAGQAGFPGQTN